MRGFLIAEIFLLVWFIYKIVCDIYEDWLKEHIDFLTEHVNDDTKPIHKECYDELSRLHANPTLLNLIQMVSVVKKFEKKLGLR